MYVGKISAQSYKSFCREFSTRTLFILVVFLTNILEVQWSTECSCVEIFPRCFLPIAQVDCIAQSFLASPFPPLEFAACSIAICYMFVLSCQDHTYLGVITEASDCEV